MSYTFTEAHRHFKIFPKNSKKPQDLTQKRSIHAQNLRAYAILSPRSIGETQLIQSCLHLRGTHKQIPD